MKLRSIVLVAFFALFGILTVNEANAQVRVEVGSPRHHRRGYYHRRPIVRERVIVRDRRAPVVRERVIVRDRPMRHRRHYRRY